MKPPFLQLIGEQGFAGHKLWNVYPNETRCIYLRSCQQYELIDRDLIQKLVLEKKNGNSVENFVFGNSEIEKMIALDESTYKHSGDNGTAPRSVRIQNKEKRDDSLSHAMNRTCAVFVRQRISLEKRGGNIYSLPVIDGGE